MAARAGLIGIHTVAAPLAVAPLGGAKAALGTNPIAFGFPLEGDPLVIDLGTSAFMAHRSPVPRARGQGGDLLEEFHRRSPLLDRPLVRAVRREPERVPLRRGPPIRGVYVAYALSIDLERADADTKARVSGDAFAGVPPEAATALRARMDRLVPLWSEYKKLVAVAG